MFRAAVHLNMPAYQRIGQHHLGNHGVLIQNGIVDNHVFQAAVARNGNIRPDDRAADLGTGVDLDRRNDLNPFPPGRFRGVIVAMFQQMPVGFEHSIGNAGVQPDIHPAGAHIGALIQ